MTRQPAVLHWRDTFREAAATITQRPLRTLLTALGTILGVGAFVATNILADTANAQVSSRFDALKATEVRIQDANPDGTNPFPTDTSARLETLNGIEHAGLYYTIPDNGNLQPRTTPPHPPNPPPQNPPHPPPRRQHPRHRRRPRRRPSRHPHPHHRPPLRHLPQ